MQPRNGVAFDSDVKVQEALSKVVSLTSEGRGGPLSRGLARFRSPRCGAERSSDVILISI